MGRFLTLCITFLFIKGAYAQQLQKITPKKEIVCYIDPVNRNTHFGPPEVFKRKSFGKTKSATIEVSYIGFSEEARVAFQYAVDIWETLIESPVPIRVQAYWRPLGTNVLGSAIWGNAFANFSNVPNFNTFYPVALAEKIAGMELNGADEPDIIANFSSSANWYLATSGLPSAGQHDLVSVVLHELGHGLGFVDSFDMLGNVGSVGLQGTGVPMIYDLGVVNDLNKGLIQNYNSPSIELGTELTSQSLFFDSPLSAAPGTGLKPQLYAPATFSGGSSIAHLDEANYPAGDPNSLMSPQIGFREVMHNPGQIVLNMFSDMGWVFTRQQHTPRNLENPGIDHKLVVTISSDNGPVSNVKLTYTRQSVGVDQIIDGVSTGNPNEFSFTIPAVGTPDTLIYFLSVSDIQNRIFTTPGKFIKPQSQGRYKVGIGNDTKSPEISHKPKEFILPTTSQLEIEASVSDNIGIKEVFVEYYIDNVRQPDFPLLLKSGTESFVSSTTANYSGTFTGKITFNPGQLTNESIISYKIKAIDNSMAQNEKLSDSFIVNVIGLAPTQDSYANNFNSPTDDFFGTGFSISTPSGFTNGAIHSTHPYPEGNGLINNEIELLWQLKIPVRVKAEDATIRFDEIVLIEPGETGSVFGSNEFYDYVVVEGSKDGGVTWTTIADGYDSRSNDDWLATYNSAISGNNSTAIGTPALYKPRLLNLLDKFQEGDEVVIRFRLYSDQLAAGWGWSVDNLRIQIDETPPKILHNHVDYVLFGTEIIPLTFQTTDVSGLVEVNVDTRVNGGTIQTLTFEVTENNNLYGIDLEIDGIPVGNKIEYRLRSKDSAGNEALLPATGFFQVPIISFGTPVTQYVTDFNSPNTDFVGNFFSIAQPSGFLNPAIHTPHPYLNGFGLTNSQSDYTLTLTRPITISSTNPYILFNEIAIVEYSGTANKDFVIIEASDDNGQTWKPLINAYSAIVQSAWKSLFDIGGNGTPANFRSRLIDLTGSGDFDAGDNILIRFRIAADATGNGWGWAMDNLSIQGPVTGVKEALDLFVSVYPNPVNDDVVTLEVKGLSVYNGQLQITNLQGQPLISESINLSGDTTRKEFSTSTWADGIYVVRLSLEDGSTVTKKLIKSSH